MSSYILRLDDACSYMNIKKWKRMEDLLKQYSITPIVGIIPDNKDTELMYIEDEYFWNRCCGWQKKNWTIAIHGLHHLLVNYKPKVYFQKSHSVKTEWAGLSLEKQYRMIEKGYHILESHGLYPSCFFAPCHTYDVSTVNAIALFNKTTSKNIYISDGYALYPYTKNDVWFLPSLFDTPHAFNWRNGVFTFVFHPNNMDEKSFSCVELFLKKHSNEFVNADNVIQRAINHGFKSQGLIGHMLESSIFTIRGIRKFLRNV